MEYQCHAIVLREIERIVIIRMNVVCYCKCARCGALDTSNDPYTLYKQKFRGPYWKALNVLSIQFGVCCVLLKSLNVYCKSEALQNGMKGHYC